MDRKISLIDYIFMLFFILLLVISVGAFFFGVKIGIDKTESKYESILVQQQVIAGELTEYHQQYLVSFYHTVYGPYTAFSSAWANGIKELENGKDRGKILSQLSSEVSKAKNVVKTSNMPEVSPLLKSAQSKYNKSLDMYKKTISDIKGLGTLNGVELTNALHKNENYSNAASFGLAAQEDFLHAIVKWNETIDPGLESSAILKKNGISIKEWSSLDLNYKNAYIATYLTDKKHFGDFLAQDLTADIDENIANGTYKQLKLKTIDEIAKTIISIQAVRSGDYLSKKEKYYADEQLPKLPFLIGSK